MKGDDYSEETLIMKILGDESFFELSPALPDTGPRLPVPHSDGLII